MSAPEVGGSRDNPAAADRAVDFMEKALVRPRGELGGTPFLLAGGSASSSGRCSGRRSTTSSSAGGSGSTGWCGWSSRGATGRPRSLAAIALYLLAGDHETAAEVYGAAKDRDQAGHVFTTASLTVQRGPLASTSPCGSRGSGSSTRGRRASIR